MRLRKYAKLSFGLLVTVTITSISASEITFAIVGKTKNDSFYEQSYKGCLEVAKRYSDLNCAYDGADDYQDVRTQVLVVRELIDKGVDGIIVSTTDSTFLTNGALMYAKERGIPVITFDSDLLPEHQNYRLAYVGTNNFDFGVALGNAANKLKKHEQDTICIQSGHQTTPNLNARIAGVRYALANDAKRKLDGRFGWREIDRCPLFTLGRREDALDQLMNFVDDKKPPLFLAVAGFAQFNPRYIAQLQPYEKRIAHGELRIVSADTEVIQLDALAKGLGSINLGQKPFEMGMVSTELLYNFIQHGIKPEKEQYYLDYHYCHSKNADTCADNH
ncbi:sugar-binding protein, putative [Pseudoalteromonas luteoviolacea B = ATCC 29581]|nr:sugar-binding protein, putative [Pseudoalteromonas luteoviolacea B = ATCC 29581]